MGLLSAFRTPKTWAGEIIEKKVSDIHDAEGDIESTKYCVVVKLHGDVERQRTLYVEAKLYEQAQVGNKVVRQDGGEPVIQLSI